MMKRTIIMALVTAFLFAACALGVNEPIRLIAFIEPYISVQPESYSFITDTPPTEAITLSIEVWDWIDDDGVLSYQWYTFESLEKYCESGGAAIPGASGSLSSALDTASYMVPLADLATEAGACNYYYVVITNTNTKADDKTEGTTRSELAIISFNAPNAAVIPVITRHPASNAYRFGESLKALEVRAFIPHEQSGPLTYQWYAGDKLSVADGTLIEGATQSTFLPDPRTLVMGGNFFYVVVTNNSMDSAAQTAMPATITMNAGLQAASPRIIRQPKDAFVFSGGAMMPLTVEAETPDSGDLSYQWYSNTIASVAGGTPLAVSGQTDKSFTPPASTAFYFVAVTNTNNNVTGAKTATVNSKPVKVTVAAAAPDTYNALVTIKDPSLPANRFNYVRGYGGMDVAWANFPETTAADTEYMYNPDTGLGYNILRIMIPPSETNIDISMNRLVNGDDSGGGFRPDYYENVRIVNKHGGYVLASPWSPPKEWKSNNSINGGGFLIYSYRQQYAQYLKSFSQHMYDKGAPIYAISIQNEANYVAGYDGCEWTPNELRDFFKAVGHFTNGVRGWGGGMETPVVLTVNGESANNVDLNYAALDDPVSNAAIDLLARHVYGERNTNLWNYSTLNGKEVWMTEHNINSASPTAYPNDSTWNFVWRFMNDVDLVMRKSNENAFVWWASKRFYSMLSDGQSGTPGGTNGNNNNRNNSSPALLRGWGLAHYAKYTIGMTRIAADVTGTTSAGSAISSSNVNYTSDDNMDDESAKITAYVLFEDIDEKNPIPRGDTVSNRIREISMVMWTPTGVGGGGGVNIGTIKIDFPAGFTAGGVMAVKSSRTDPTATVNPTLTGVKIMEPEEVALSSDRKSAYVTLNVSEMLSVRFTNADGAE